MKRFFKFYWAVLLLFASIILIGCPTSAVLTDLETAENIMNKKIPTEDADGNELTAAQKEQARMANALEAWNKIKSHMETGGTDDIGDVTNTKLEVHDHGIEIDGRYLALFGKIVLGLKGITFVELFSSFLNTSGTSTIFNSFAGLMPQDENLPDDLTEFYDDLNNTVTVMDSIDTNWPDLVTESATAVAAAAAEGLWYLKEDYKYYDEYKDEINIISGFISFFVFNAIANGPGGYSELGTITDLETASTFVDSMTNMCNTFSDAGISATVIDTLCDNKPSETVTAVDTFLGVYSS